MKNLHLWDVCVKDLKLNYSKDEFNACYGHDEANAGVLYVCSNTLIMSKFDENCEEKWSKDLSETASPDNRPVDVTFLSLPNVLCVGLANGELFTIGNCGAKCDLAAVCENGILAMEWSPDQELLVIVTRNMTMLMSCMFDPVHEVNLLGDEFGEGQFITVDWGKKETQFHGSEGEQAVKVKTEVTADSDDSDKDNDDNYSADNTVKITWRGDGNLYAVGFTQDGVRRFKVFDREGHLQYTSEKQQGLETNLSWRPSGNAIATTQRLSDKYVVTFYEENGLKHGRLEDIPVENTTIVEDLLWSSDSEILMLQCKDTETNSQKLLLYTTSNYHWYLKQSLIFTSEQVISKILWDNDFEDANNKKLHILLQDGKYFTYSWIWDIDHSRGKGDDDDAIVTVIDGKKLLVTGFRQTAVPPPKATLDIELESFINSVHFAPQTDESTNSFFVITADHKLIMFQQINKFPLRYTTLYTIGLEEYDFPYQCYNWHWMNHDTIVHIRADTDNDYNLVEYSIHSNELTLKNVESLPIPVLRIQSHSADPTVAFLLLRNDEIVQYNIGGAIEPRDFAFAATCPKFSVISIDDDLHAVALSSKGNLYIDCSMIMNNVSSYFVHTHFLLITTLKHVLLCTELTKSGLIAIMEYSKNESPNVYKRKIQRGAKIVIAVPNDTRTVFQMPRGNLETILPRPLSLKVIGTLLNSLKYNEAFELMRKERINLNLIYDHNPRKFINYIQVFLESIKNNSSLIRFLSDLENIDVTETMYASSYAERPSKVIEEYENNKVQTICALVRSFMSMRSDIDNRILPYLTTFVKTNTVGDLERALSLIKDIKLKEADGAKMPIGSDEAMKYLLYMVDVKSLFDVALGMYDFDLVLLVANTSQKDPKEFIPMLNEINEMEKNYKRFTINKHLKRFDKALKCLMQCGPEKLRELKTFVKFHSLYEEALSLFNWESKVYKEISDDFGLYLRLKKQYTEAGVIYQRGSNYDKAIECYKDALEWELAINLAQQWPKERFRELCGDLVKALKEDKRHKEALTIMEQFYDVDDGEETIKCAIEAGQYKTALRLCTQYGRTDLRDDMLISAILDEYKYLRELIETNRHDFIERREWLCLVRETRRRNDDEIRDSDLYYDAGSTLASSSKGSSKSFRSLENKRKHERKVASLKERSQCEDVTLIRALYTLVTSSFELRFRVKEVNTALCCFYKNKKAVVLQSSLETLLREMKESLDTIWTEDLVMEVTIERLRKQNSPEDVSIMPLGFASLEPHVRIAPVIQDVRWKLDCLFYR